MSRTSPLIALIYFGVPLNFINSLKLLNMASNHLDIMKVPFKDNAAMSSEEITNARAAIRRFRDKSVD